MLIIIMLVEKNGGWLDVCNFGECVEKQASVSICVLRAVGQSFEFC